MLAGMKAYSLDLRQKILRACDQRLGSQHAIGILFGVSLSFVEQGLRPTLRSLRLLAQTQNRRHPRNATPVRITAESREAHAVSAVLPGFRST